jgi:UDP-N-acetylmuramoyl-L-alanyl-D-glutamate--2,6-diaminopimelate ligase
MTLRDLLGAGPPVEISGLAFDNRAVEPGTLFFCVPGFTRDGHDFAPDAVARGAAALVVQRPLGLGVPEVLVDDVRAAMARAAARFHGDPTHRLPVVGVTGTNGKTTTTFLIRSLLEAAGRPCGLLGTVVSVVGGQARATKRTTPEAIDLQRTFADMLASGDRACAMEVSSHALELRRTAGIRFAVSVFTNLTQDHLDFHPTMEDYFLAKRRLFAAGDDAGIRVAGVDDPYGRRLADEFAGTTTFALDREADYRATDVRSDWAGSTFTVRTPGGTAHAVALPLPGRFNVENALAAWAAVAALGVPDATIAAALPDVARVPGRLEPVEAGQGFGVLVDYAHTPDSLENVLAAARGLTSGRVLAVVGAGGDRDRGKRPLMGEIAARLADVALVTSDNPRSEPPGAILDEILAGVPAEAVAAGRVERIEDRRAAIARAVALAAPGDVVLIAGKGHEQGQELAGGRVEPFDDVAVARAALEAAGARGASPRQP